MRESFIIDFGNFHFRDHSDFEFLSKVKAYEIIAPGKLTPETAFLLRNSKYKKAIDFKQE